MCYQICRTYLCQWASVHPTYRQKVLLRLLGTASMSHTSTSQKIRLKKFPFWSLFQIFLLSATQHLSYILHSLHVKWNILSSWKSKNEYLKLWVNDYSNSILCISGSSSVYLTRDVGKTADLIALRRSVMLYKMRVKQTRLLLKRWKVDWEGNVWQDVHEQWEWEQPWEDCQQKSIQELWRTSQWADWGWCECIKSQVKALKQGLQLLHYMQEWPDPISCSWTRGSVRREKKKNLLYFILKVWRKSVES